MASDVLALISSALPWMNREYKATRAGIDADFYKTTYNQQFLAKLSPALHYHSFGWRQGLDPSPLFDTRWYLKEYADVDRRGRNPFAHFMQNGWSERRDPSANFNTAWYVARYTDVATARLNPFLHYRLHGLSEGRAPKPPDVMQALADDLDLIVRGGQSAVNEVPWRIDLDDFEAKRIEPTESGWWRSTVNDPQLVLKRHVKAGFIRIRIRGRFEQIRTQVAREAVCEVYFDLGKGFFLDQAFTYPVRDGLIAVDDLVLIESDACRIRVDPINTDCRFSFEHITIESKPLTEAVSQLYRSYCWRNGTQLHSDSDFMDEMVWSNVARFVKTQGQSLSIDGSDYEHWIAARRIGPQQKDLLSQGSGDSGPLFSILMPTYKSDLRYLKMAINSVRTQIHKRWELCIVDDGSADPFLQEFLDLQMQLDRRIRVEHAQQNCGIAAATNRALAMAGGEFIALLDHDDELAPHALLMMAQAINGHPTADLLYSDEDKIDVDGVRSNPLFKPDWSPEFFMSCMYTCHLGVYRRELVKTVGGFRSAFDFAQDYDMALRVSARARAIVHVPDILYHWRVLPSSTAGGADAKPDAEHAARRALQAHVDATGLRGTALPGPFAGSHRIKLDLIGDPSVSLVIPTAARRINKGEERWYLLDLLRSIRDTSTYRNYEIVIVDNGDVEPALEAALTGFDLVRVHYGEPVFNYPEKANLGVAAAGNDYVILLNDDMTIITPGWMEELVSWLQRPGIVAAGGKLLFPDNTVQHAGILLLGQGPSHAYYGAADEDAGLVGSAILHRNYCAVTGACIAVAKQTYQAVGGYDRAFRVNYNDVDFCLKLARLGRIVYTPYAKLYHYESVSRDDSPDTELQLFHSRWDDLIGADPYYSMHYSQSAVNAVTRFAVPLFDQLSLNSRRDDASRLETTGLAV